MHCKALGTSVPAISSSSDHCKRFEHGRMFFTLECNMPIIKCYIMPSSCCKRVFRNDNIKN